MTRAVPSLNESIKMITTNLIHTMDMADIVFGTVVKESPLEIQIDQNFTLTEPFLILSNMVKDHEVDIQVSLKTNNDNYMIPDHTHTGNMGSPTDGGTLDTTHLHDVQGRKKIIMYYGLKLNEKVILLKMQGGQRYLVLDRVETPPTEGEWI